MTRRFAQIAGIGIALLMAPVAGRAQANGGFEDGTLNDWLAPDGGVEVLQADDFVPSIPVPEGSYFALVSTGPDDQSRPSGEIDGNGISEFDITTLRRSFTVGAGATVSFRWAFLTSEQFEAATFDDVLSVTIDGVAVLERSVNKPGGDSPFPDSPGYDGQPYSVSSSGATDGSAFDNGTSGFSTFLLTMPDAGTYTLEIRVADQGDAGFDTGVLIDDFVVGPPGSGISQITDTASQAFVEAKGGGLVGRFVQNNDVATAPDGTVQVFASSANLSGDNPGGEIQVFAWDGAAFTRLTAMTSGSASPGAASASSRWVTYAATDDPLGTNGDLNQEVFRYDLVNRQWRQITDTTSCTSQQPTVSDDGARIAFLTECADAGAGFNPDGNLEVAVWDEVLGFSGVETSGCSSGEPELADDGSLVVYTSTCDPTGGNGDGNSEVFAWNPFGGSPAQLTATGAAVVNHSPSVSADGGEIAFVSDGDFAGDNADGSYEVFVFNGSAYEQATDGSATVAQFVARIDPTGQFVGGMAVDLLGGDSELFYVARPGGTPVSVISGEVGFPDIAFADGQPLLVFEASEDLVGDNADGNTEIFRSTAVFSPPVNQCSSPMAAIPNGSPSGVWDDIVVTPGRTIADLDISLVIDHNYVNDLVVELEHLETGTAVVLIDRITRDSGGPCFLYDIDAVLDDEGARDVGTECPWQIPVVLSPPSFTPEEPLATFDGESTAGTWRLTAADVRNNSRSGTLLQWCVDFETN